ncbi:MAG: galactose ABC transporter substrate-binding protein [Clostridia bacterium]|nr:galactose ABC transporter substrate-binding protein [Clostridia bacterium]
MKKILSIFIVTIILSLALCGCKNNMSDKPIIGVCLYKYDDTYISTVRQELENIVGDKAVLYLNDGKGDQGTQNDQIDLLIQKKVDVLVVNLVDVGAAQTVINKAKNADIPIIFFNREPSKEVLDSYNKAIFIGTNAKEAGIIQGEIVAKTWKSNEKYDRNKDGILQYVLLKGEPDNPEAVARTDYSLSTIKENGIDIEELGLQVCNWDTELANSAMTGWLSKYPDQIECVIANNDAMAQGAISALQSIGFNKGDKEKYIPVVGVDATDAAKDLIKKGYMTATVLQDGKAMAEAINTVAINVSKGNEFLMDTIYEFDMTGKAIRIPYQSYEGEK